MTDIPKTLRDMPRDEAIEIFEHWLDTGEVLVPCGLSWEVREGGQLARHRIYRLPVTYPTVDWSHVADWVQYIAFDASEKAFGYDAKPEITSGAWFMDDGERYASADAISSLTRGTCDWRDSLISRPTEGKE